MSVVTALLPALTPLITGGFTLGGVMLTRWYGDRQRAQERAQERASAANAEVRDVVVALTSAAADLRLALVHNVWVRHAPALRVVLAANRASLLPHGDVRDAARDVSVAAIRTAVVAYDMDNLWQRKKARQKADDDLSAALSKLDTAARAHLYPAAETTQKDVT